ncbi:MAG TPA: ParB/RepB/Spo0J family partition protein [Bacillota bacterium]|nr:ParB/RepB/Spo0J family partition protein [Bacillota bacterium]
MTKKGLGRGLSALLPDAEPRTEDVTSDQERILELPVKDIHPREDQPRRFFSEEKLEELAQSIREHGLIQPIVVAKLGKGYQIIAGERRWRACVKLGQDKIPAIVREAGDVEISEIALIENLQRENLNAIEEALALKRLLTDFSLTQEQVAQKIGKSRPYIANSLRLLNLPEQVQLLVAGGKLTSGHVRPLAGLKDVKLQKELAEAICKKGLSVRQAEQLAKEAENRAPKPEGAKDQRVKRDPVLVQVEDKMRSRFGTGVRIKNQGTKGRIEIDYYSDDDFNRILELVLGIQEF